MRCACLRAGMCVYVCACVRVCLREKSGTLMDDPPSPHNPPVAALLPVAADGAPIRRSDLVSLEVAHYFYPQCMLTAAAHKFASVMGGTIFTINILKARRQRVVWYLGRRQADVRAGHRRAARSTRRRRRGGGDCNATANTKASLVWKSCRRCRFSV